MSENLLIIGSPRASVPAPPIFFDRGGNGPDQPFFPATDTHVRTHVAQARADGAVKEEELIETIGPADRGGVVIELCPSSE